MSEPRLIEPLLTRYIMGTPMESRNGVCCCPAMRKGTDDKYIVKILSIPASKVQMEALLLTGAYPSKEAVLAYFKDLTESAAQEAVLLEKLAGLEGFLAYDGWQIVPMENGSGWELYLLGKYRPTLARQLQTKPMTHLGAVNLGLDLCAALSVSRRNGYLYVDLKPENIFLTGTQEFRIGDIGFIALDSLKYASLPDRYRSAYTAPEVTDAYSDLNSTLDIYAAGLVLYQVYNNGELPHCASGEALPPPAYADYEMAEIILKACATDPAERWQEPAEMGQALVSYMQRNSINDVPIIPPVIPEPEEAPVPEDVPGEVSVEEPSEVPASEPEEPAEVEPVTEEPEVPEEPEMPEDETVPTEETSSDLDDAVVTEEVTEMLAQADELIAHPTPEPVVAPEPVEISMPEPIVPEPEEIPEEASAEPSEEAPAPAEEQASPETEIVDEPAAVAVATVTEEKPVKPHKKHTGLVVTLVTVLVLLILVTGGFHFYENYYLQPILKIELLGDEDYLTVTLDTEIDNSLLTVSCIDTYGNKLQQPVKDNTAHFTQLKPSSDYKIFVEISGFHKLIGTTNSSYTTAAQTSIVSFTAKTGDQDGSVNLSFSVQGPENTTWRVRYWAPGVAEKIADCTNHGATVTGLEIGAKYTFKLEPVADLYVVGNDTLEYTALKAIYPENLTITGYHSGALVATWNAPADTVVNNWLVTYYPTGDETNAVTLTVSEPTVAIEGLNSATAYTVEVKAEGMSFGDKTDIKANSITFNDLLMELREDKLVITWTYEGTAPADGWRLFYTVNDGAPQVIHCTQNTATISPVLPGATYHISFDLPETVTVFGGTGEFTAPGAPRFDSYGVTYENFKFRMCHTPANVGWKWNSLMESEFTTSFKIGEKASFVMLVDVKPQLPEENVETLYVIRDEAGNEVSIHNGRTRVWGYMWSEWNGQYATELDVPFMPQVPGSYTVDIFFNGALVTSQGFTIS